MNSNDNDGEAIGRGRQDSTDRASIIEFTGQYYFLSNKHPATFVFDGVRYGSASQAYYVLRAADPDIVKRLLELTDVDEIVRLGKSCVPVKDWNIISRDVLKRILIAKFSSPFLRDMLLKTGDRVLGDGRNFLGGILMEVRLELE